jgi:endonuclease-3 related protein
MNVNATAIKSLYDCLYARFGDLRWWPAQSPYEIMVGAILTQNTAWSNVEKAVNRFPNGVTPQFVAEAGMETLIDIIRPAGFFNQKAVYLKTLTEWYHRYHYSVQAVRSRPWREIRAELLALRGVGKETADSILLYAFDCPVFVVDAYTLRLLKRLSAAQDPLTYDEAQTLFESALDPAQYNNAHALIVVNAKAHCRSKPVCARCPVSSLCASAPM